MMPIFTINGVSLEPISEMPFILEKDIQTIAEKNMKTIFGLEYITSELKMNDLRIDTLAFDEEQKSFVIIEYKRDKNFSVIDQGFAYLAALLKHKADIILLYNEKTSKTLKKGDIDWKPSKLIFIAPFYTDYQRKAIEFRVPIELWEIRKYSNNTIFLNQIQVPGNGESIMDVGMPSEVIRSVSKEIVTYTEDYVLQRCNARIRDVYRELKDLILSLNPSTTIKIKKNYIAFVRKRTFVSINPKRSWLLLFLGLRKGELSDPKQVTIRVPGTEGHYTVTHYSLRVNDKSDLDYVLTLIKQAYDKN